MMTSQLLRKQIYIHKRQQALLKQLAKKRGMSEAEIIRQAIDREAANSMPLPSQASQENWDETMAFMRSLADRRDRFQEPLRWNRSELYEERLNRLAGKLTPTEDQGSKL
jgi:hypothetical protein